MAAKAGPTGSGNPVSDGAPPSFEAALARLEEIVARLEAGQVTLDESLSAFREGSGLVRFCIERLTAAETAVRELVAGEAGPVARASTSGFDAPEDEDA